MRSLIFENDDIAGGHWLNRSSLQSNGGKRNEAWLQELLFLKPDLVPIDTLAPGTAGYVPICRELGLPKIGAMVFLDI